MIMPTRDDEGTLATNGIRSISRTGRRGYRETHKQANREGPYIYADSRTTGTGIKPINLRNSENEPKTRRVRDR